MRILSHQGSGAGSASQVNFSPQYPGAALFQIKRKCDHQSDSHQRGGRKAQNRPFHFLVLRYAFNKLIICNDCKAAENPSAPAFCAWMLCAHVMLSVESTTRRPRLCVRQGGTRVATSWDHTETAVSLTAAWRVLGWWCTWTVRADLEASPAPKALYASRVAALALLQRSAGMSSRLTSISCCTFQKVTCSAPGPALQPHLNALSLCTEGSPRQLCHHHRSKAKSALDTTASNSGVQLLS